MKLTEKRYEAFAEMALEIHNRIDRAASLYNELLKEAGVPMKDEVMLHNGQTWLEELQCSIWIDWSTSWAYGGHDAGSCHFDMADLVDATWEESITKRAEETIAKHQKKVKEKEAGIRRQEREQYHTLRQKFEKDDAS